MINIIITNNLKTEAYKTFKKDSMRVYSLIETLRKNPNKDRVLGHVGHMSIRELRYKNFMPYFILDGRRLDLFNKDKIKELLIKFIAMSKKHNQQRTIGEIKDILKLIDSGQ